MQVARFSHSYDLSQHRASDDVTNCEVFDHLSASYRDTLDYIRSTVESNSETVVRVVVDRPFYPVENEGEFLRFHYALRRVLSAKHVVSLLTYPLHTMSDSLGFHLPQLSNYSIEVESLPRDKTSVYKDYHGILHLHKIDSTCSFTRPQSDMSDRFFKVQRKKFVIEKMHLPPDLSETVSRSSSSGGGGGGGCGGSGGNSPLDF